MKESLVQFAFYPIFRATFNLSNKIALLILFRMYALSVKKKQFDETKFENVSKE